MKTSYLDDWRLVKKGNWLVIEMRKIGWGKFWHLASKYPICPNIKNTMNDFVQVNLFVLKRKRFIR
jgi:hypothetical protein